MWEKSVKPNARHGLWMGLAVLGALVLRAAPAGAQAEAYLEIRKGERYRVPVIIDDFVWSAGDAVACEGGERAETILAKDLLYTDAFVVIRDATSAPIRLDVLGQPVNRPVQARVRGEIETTRRGWSLKGTLIDEGSRKKIFEHTYPIELTVNGEADRWGLHLFADEVTRYLTGTPGCAATRIVFVRAASDTKDLYMIDWDGWGAQRATHLNSILLCPEWHPSGRWVAFTSYHRTKPALYSYDLERGEIETITTDDAPVSAAYSPDGKQIAYSTTRDGNAEIYIARRDGSRARRLTFHTGIDTEPSWAPSGKRLVFTSDRWGNPQLFAINSDGTDLLQLTQEGSWNGGGDWSPVGDRIVHLCRIDGSFELALVDADGMGWRRLTIGGGCGHPRWAPDGRHVVFSRAAQGREELWILDVDTSSLRQLTRFNGQSYNPAWSDQAMERLSPLNLGG